MAWYNWSQTAASNANADTSINWAEGQAPSSVNDSARAMMAATAKYRDDIAGAIVTGGTSTAYTLSSFSNFDTLAHLNGQIIAFSPHATNGAGPVTLLVDSLTAKPLRSSPGVELLAGTIIQGTPYLVVYNNSDGAFYLQGFYGNPYNVPLGAGMDYWLPTAPNSSFVFPTGQAISRTTYATLFAAMSTTYGIGDGSTTFNLPDKTGRSSVMKEATATRLTTAGSGVDGGTMGATGGAQNATLAQSALPNVTLTASVNSTNSNIPVNVSNGAIYATTGAGSQPIIAASIVGQLASTGTTASINGNVTQTAVHTVQPTIVCNYILRVV